MTRLEELIYALATVIVRYHDSQDNIDIKDKLVAATGPTMRKKKSHERAIEIIQDKKTNFPLFLEGRIHACTVGYQARKEFLSYILTEISYLKEQHDRKSPFEPKELQKLEEQLTQLFIDFRQLLSIYKSSKYSVTLMCTKGTKKQELGGLLNDRYVGGKYCNSGQLLIDEVFSVLNITTEDSNEELKAIAANICFEQQISLEHQNDKLKKATEESEKEMLKIELEAMKLKLEAQTSEFVAQTLLLEQIKSEKSNLEPQFLELTEKYKDQEKTIEELTQELEKTKAELQKSQTEVAVKRYPLYSPLLGLNGLHMLPKTGNTRFFASQTNQHPTTSSPTAEDFEDRSKYSIE